MNDFAGLGYPGHPPDTRSRTLLKKASGDESDALYWQESPADDAEVRRRGRATKHGQGKVEEAGAVRVSIRIRPAMTEEERDECWETWSGAKGDTLTLVRARLLPYPSAPILHPHPSSPPLLL